MKSQSLRSKITPLIGAIAFLLAIPADLAAGNKSHAKQQSDLEKYDTNKDGKLDKDEKEAMRADKERQRAEKRSAREAAEKNKDKKADADKNAEAEKKAESDNKVQVDQKEPEKPAAKP